MRRPFAYVSFTVDLNVLGVKTEKRLRSGAPKQRVPLSPGSQCHLPWSLCVATRGGGSKGKQQLSECLGGSFNFLAPPTAPVKPVT